MKHRREKISVLVVIFIKPKAGADGHEWSCRRVWQRGPDTGGAGPHVPPWRDNWAADPGEITGFFLKFWREVRNYTQQILNVSDPGAFHMQKLGRPFQPLRTFGVRPHRCRLILRTAQPSTHRPFPDGTIFFWPAFVLSGGRIWETSHDSFT